jgi:hypothetical protein
LPPAFNSLLAKMRPERINMGAKIAGIKFAKTKEARDIQPALCDIFF